ncbi:DNA repair protein RecN [Halocynthiibacter sp. C4]|uniref:DNA repair protein RecN n=1 Tax=Halocynthiibacter sp. C4 TaxID=2992758 RepID=UPI00237A5889|nr:DNA repair protein RecN [Halocynthiibacter sp. C4]MDE0589214.1 DNA repair protein RecN [Halocynthiibacter sp. C4]
MLRSLEIRDMLIIDHLSLEFQAGLNVLTGETGAGKSILLDSLGFVLGWRGRAELVRSGAKQGEVTACFEIPSGHNAQKVLDEAGIPYSDEELILRRVNSADGRKTAWINDRRASGEVLRALSETLVELHGQHDDRGLLNPRGHRKMLDAYGGLESRVAKTSEAWRALSAAQKTLLAEEAHLADLREEEDFLRHSVEELDALSPVAGEEAELDTRRRQLQAATRVADDVTKARDAIGGQGAEALIVNALRWLEDSATQLDGTFDRGIEALTRALNELSEGQSEIESALDGLRFNPGELEDCEERLFAIRALARKHGVLADDLAAHADELRKRLVALDQGAGNIGALKRALEEAQAAYEDAANALSAARKAAAKKLDTAMAKELAPLKMERAVFETQFNEIDGGPEGSDDVVFTVATNPGAPSGALNKIASGGELSRFLLALKVCLTSGTKGITMIFDEIDRGVGGATADAVGRRLAALAAEGQVLVVTHSPQVAALGGHHWRVEKRIQDGSTLSTVVPLAAEDRVDEVARMLSGDRITNEARAAAKTLLAG